jgi:hypothetical protein
MRIGLAAEDGGGGDGGGGEGGGGEDGEVLCPATSGAAALCVEWRQRDDGAVGGKGVGLAVTLLSAGCAERLRAGEDVAELEWRAAGGRRRWRSRHAACCCCSCSPDGAVDDSWACSRCCAMVVAAFAALGVRVADTDGHDVATTVRLHQSGLFAPDLAQTRSTESGGEAYASNTGRGCARRSGRGVGSLFVMHGDGDAPLPMSPGAAEPAPTHSVPPSPTPELTSIGERCARSRSWSCRSRGESRGTGPPPQLRCVCSSRSDGEDDRGGGDVDRAGEVLARAEREDASLLRGRALVILRMGALGVPPNEAGLSLTLSFWRCSFSTFHSHRPSVEG